MNVIYSQNKMSFPKMNKLLEMDQPKEFFIIQDAVIIKSFLEHRIQLFYPAKLNAYHSSWWPQIRNPAAAGFLFL